MGHRLVAALALALALFTAPPAHAQSNGAVMRIQRHGRMSRTAARVLARTVHDRLVENAGRGGDRYDPLRQSLGRALFDGPGTTRPEYDRRLAQVLARLAQGLTEENLTAFFVAGEGAALRCSGIFGVNIAECDALIAAGTRVDAELPHLPPDDGAALTSELAAAGVSRDQAAEIVRSLGATLRAVPASVDSSPRGRRLVVLLRDCPGGLDEREARVRAWHLGPTSDLARCIGVAIGRDGRNAPATLTSVLGMAQSATVAFLRWSYGQPVQAARARAPLPPVAAVRPPAQTPRATPPAQPDLRAMREEARAHFIAERFVEAERAYRRLTQVASSDAPAFAGLAASLFALGLAPEAAAAYTRATELDPRNAGYFAALGEAQERASSLDAARAAFERALAIDAAHADAREGLARVIAAAEAPPESVRRPPPRVEARPVLPEVPPRDEIMRALAPYAARLVQCNASIDAVVTFRIRITGADGAVQEIEALAPFAGTPEASCMESHLLAVQFPRFSRQSFEIRYPFRLRGTRAAQPDAGVQ